MPVFALISQISATGQVHYVGLDNWKVGRTAAWVFEHVCKAPGKLGILVGNHRYRCQEMNESGFRSYFREHAPDFTLLEPLLTFESSAIAQEMTEKLLQRKSGSRRPLCRRRRHHRRHRGAPLHRPRRQPRRRRLRTDGLDPRRRCSTAR